MKIPKTFRGKGQINRGSPFGMKISLICQQEDVKNIIEVGTWNGQGTTICVMNGIINKKKSL